MVNQILAQAMLKRGFWDEQQRETKLQGKKPLLSRLSEPIPWELFRPLLRDS